jgi:hypothetical protein
MLTTWFSLTKTASSASDLWNHPAYYMHVPLSRAFILMTRRFPLSFNILYWDGLHSFNYLGFEVLPPVVMNSSIFWYIRLVVRWKLTLLATGCLSGLFFRTEDGADMLLWTFGSLSMDKKVLYPRRQNSSLRCLSQFCTFIIIYIYIYIAEWGYGYGRRTGKNLAGHKDSLF